MYSWQTISELKEAQITTFLPYPEFVAKFGARVYFDERVSKEEAMGFRELTDEQWSFLQSFMPPPSRRGRPRLDDRKVLNGILFVLTTGCRWADMPRRYCHPTTAWRRLKELQEEGVWQKILQSLL